MKFMEEPAAQSWEANSGAGVSAITGLAAHTRPRNPTQRVIGPVTRATAVQNGKSLQQLAKSSDCSNTHKLSKPVVARRPVLPPPHHHYHRSPSDGRCCNSIPLKQYPGKKLNRAGQTLQKILNVPKHVIKPGGR